MENASKMKTHKCLTSLPKKKSIALITQAISNALRKLKCSIPMEEILEIHLNSFNYSMLSEIQGSYDIEQRDDAIYIHFFTEEHIILKSNIIPHIIKKNAFYTLFNVTYYVFKLILWHGRTQVLEFSMYSKFKELLISQY